MKHSENSVPSFADLAIQYETINRDQLAEALLLIDEKKTQGETISLEDALIQKKMATKYQINLLLVIRDFLIIRKRSEQFGQIAIQKGFATPEQIKHALAIQQKLFREKRVRKMVGVILTASGVLTEEQQKQIASEQHAILKEHTSVEIKNETDGDTTENITSQASPPAREYRLKKFNQNPDDPPEPEKNITRPARKADSQTRKADSQKRSYIKISISEDSMEAWAEIDWSSFPVDSSGTGNNAGDPYSGAARTSEEKSDSDQASGAENGKNLEQLTESDDEMLSPLPDIESVKSALNSAGVVNGICSDALIKYFLDRKSSPFIVASGEYLETATIQYHFDTWHLVGDTQVKRNKPIVSINSGNVESKVNDVSGREGSYPQSAGRGLAPTFHPVFRCGDGAVITEDGMSVLADRSGYPAINLYGKIHVCPVINVLEDADTHFGPIDPYAFLNVAGTLTGAYPVTAGQITAYEIRGANISSIGDITVEMGINGSRIRTHGCLKAKYIHNARIEAFGDVEVEHEIIDSTIITGGRCIASKSRVIASVISARMGVVAAGIGSDVTEPCRITIGGEEHTATQLSRIEKEISDTRKELDTLVVERESLEASIKKLFQKMVEFKKIHDHAKEQYDEFNRKIESGELVVHDNGASEVYIEDMIHAPGDPAAEGFFDGGDKTMRLINALKSKMETAVEELKKYNRKKKEEELAWKTTDDRIRTLQPEVEEKIASLVIDRNRLLKWAREHQPSSEAKIYGRVAQDTVIKGAFSTLVIKDEIRSVKISEKCEKDSSGPCEIEITPL